MLHFGKIPKTNWLDLAKAQQHFGKFCEILKKQKFTIQSRKNVGDFWLKF